MVDMHEIWINLPKFSQGYINGVKAFIENAFVKMAVGEEMACPCKNCKNNKWHGQDIVFDHLICSGPAPVYANWNYVKARYVIPDELESWVIETIHSSWKTYKSRTKAGHFTAYENDEMRLENRPDDIPLETFKMLLDYWNDESIQEKARKNANARKHYVDTHTLGPKSLAQYRYKMKKVPGECEPCDAKIFIDTRKRDAKREYKISTEKIEKKIETITKRLSTGDAASDELGAKHGLNWLKGRCVKPANMSNSNAPTETYVKDLTTKIKEGFAAELEEKVKKVESEFQDKVKQVEAGVDQKVQQNLAFVFKKLAQANPDIKIDIQELCTTVGSDNDDGTPMTGGVSF